MSLLGLIRSDGNSSTTFNVDKLRKMLSLIKAILTIQLFHPLLGTTGPKSTYGTARKVIMAGNACQAIQQRRVDEVDLA